MLAYAGQCELTIKPSYILLHKESLILRLQPSCCRFPRVPAVSAAPPIVSLICSPIGSLQRHVNATSPAHKIAAGFEQLAPDVTGSVPTRKYYWKLRCFCLGSIPIWIYSRAAIRQLTLPVNYMFFFMPCYKDGASCANFPMDVRAGKVERVRPLFSL